MLKQGRRDKAMLAQGFKMSDLPPPENLIEEVDDRQECASCGRKFNQAAYERHIQHCSNTKNKPTRLTRGGGKGGGRAGHMGGAKKSGGRW